MYKERQGSCAGAKKCDGDSTDLGRGLGRLVEGVDKDVLPRLALAQVKGEGGEGRVAAHVDPVVLVVPHTLDAQVGRSDGRVAATRRRLDEQWAVLRDKIGKRK